MLQYALGPVPSEALPVCSTENHSPVAPETRIYYSKLNLTHYGAFSQ